MTEASVRLKSKAAYWSRAIGRFSFFSFLLSIIIYFFELIHTQEFLLLILFVTVGAIFSFLLAIIGLISLWKDGRLAGIASMIGLFYSFCILTPIFVCGFLFYWYPPLYDISTDPIDPPFLEESYRPANALKLERYLSAQKDIQEQTWPKLSSRSYADPPNVILPFVFDALRKENWKIVRAPEKRGNDGALYVEAVARSFLFSFPSDIIIRLKMRGARTIVDMRATSRYFSRDMGVNAAYIESFMRKLDEAIVEANLGELHFK